MPDKPQTKPDAPPADQTVEQGESVPFASSGGPTATETNPAFGPAAAEDEVGTLGPYRVVKELGRGGMGAVYLAFDERLKRKVALKVMLPKYAAVASSKNRFIREARAAAGITHDHIVTIYEADAHDDVPYMAMQFLQGYPLDDYLKQKGGLDLAETLRIGRETALGLAAAHGIGLAHRDIKPANLWVEAPTGRIKILDFGLAKPTQDEEQDTELTATGVILGTPAFMAPEQARGEKADARADLFSLGVVLYRLATGHAPFHGKTMMAMLTAVVADTPTPVRERNPAVPEAFAKLIHQLLEKDPARRPASAAAVADAIRRIEKGPAPLHAIPLDALPTQAFVLPGADPFAEIDATEPGDVVHAPAAPAPRRPLPKWPLAALAVLLVGVLAFIPQIIKVMTPKGTLVIETTDPDVEVTVKKGTATIFDKTKQREIALAVGDDYTIDLVEHKDGLKLSTKSFEITKNGKTTVKVRVEKPPVAAGPKAAARFKELLGGTDEELTRWAAALPPGYRPSNLSARQGSNPVRYDAVALPLPGEWHLFAGPEPKRRREFTDELLNRTHQVHHTAAVANNVRHDAELLMPGAGGMWWFHNGEDAADKGFAQGMHAVGLRPRPTSVAGFGTGWSETRYWACGPAGPPWEARYALAAADLQRLADECRARGWRPELIATYAADPPLRFRAVVTENRPEYEWKLAVGVTAEECKKQLKDRTEHGFFPKCVCSGETAGRVEYTILWLKEPAAYRVTADQRKAMQAVLDAGGELFCDAFDSRVYLPPSTTVPDVPLRFLGMTSPAAGWKDVAGLQKLAALPAGCEFLQLADAGFRDEHLAGFAAIPGLATVKWLKVSGMTLTDAGLPTVAKFKDLEDFELVGTPVTGTGFAALKGLKALQFLQLDDCGKLTDDGLAAIGELPALKRMYLFRTNLTDAGVNHLANVATMEELSLFGPGVTDKCVPTLKKFAHLKRLIIGACGITDAGLRDLSSLPRLTELRVHESTKFTAMGLAAVKDFPALTTMELSACGESVTDAVILGLKGAVKLTHLDLHGTRVTADGVKKLAALIPQCRIVWDGDTVEPTAPPPAAAADPLEIRGATQAALAEWVAKLPPGHAPTWVAARTGGTALLFDALAAAASGATDARLVTWTADNTAAYDELKTTHRLVAEVPYLVDGKYHTIDVGVRDGRTWNTWYGNLGYIREKIEEGQKTTRENDGVNERWLPSALSAVRQADGSFTYSAISTWLPDRAFEWRPELSPKELAAAVEEYRKKGWRPHVVNTIYGTSEPTYLAAFVENPTKEAWDFTPNLSAADYEKHLADRKAKGERPRCVCSHEADGKVTYTVVWDGKPAAK